MTENSVFAQISDFLKNENVEYFASLDFSQCEIINERRLPDFEVKSVVVFLIPYYTGEHKDRNVSLYSVSYDYHLYAKELDERLKEKFTDCNIKCAVYSDSSPVNERKLAIKAALGVLGENGLVINEKYGSYVFVGCIFTDAVFEKEEYATVSDKRACLKCGKCKKACGYLDGRQDVCFSSLTQKKKVTEEELRLIHSRKIRWGCDICQDVCPMNQMVSLTPIKFFYENVVQKLDVKMLEEMSDEEFSKRAYSWRGREVIKRNIDG